MKDLRQYIRFLVEAAVGGEQAAKAGSALYRRSAGKFVHYILYDPRALQAATKDPGFFSGRFKDLGSVVLAYIQAHPRSGECNNATQITVSVAGKGYGPLLYDVVMSDSEGGIMPDRNSTSPAARNVWQHYAAKRSDTEQHPFDDKDDPKTPDPDDDCYLVDDKLLDQSFDGAGQGGAKAKLLQNHEEAMATIGSKEIPRKALESTLFQMADDYFNERYGK